MERIHDILTRPGSKAGGGLWKEYMNAVDEWNVNLKYYEEDLRRLVGQDFVWELNNYETDGGCPEQPESIHGKFFCSHRLLVALQDCGDCPNRDQLVNQVAAGIRDLNFQTDAFVARAGSIFLDRSAELEEFKFQP
jgi:hypothetical protein